MRLRLNNKISKHRSTIIKELRLNTRIGNREPLVISRGPARELFAFSVDFVTVLAVDSVSNENLFNLGVFACFLDAHIQHGRIIPDVRSVADVNNISNLDAHSPVIVLGLRAKRHDFICTGNFIQISKQKSSSI